MHSVSVFKVDQAQISKMHTLVSETISFRCKPKVCMSIKLFDATYGDGLRNKLWQ